MKTMKTMKRHPILKSDERRQEKHTTPGIAPDDTQTADCIIMLVSLLFLFAIALTLFHLAQ